MSGRDMTERETVDRLRAALVYRAETGMSTTDTGKELDRLQDGMRHQAHRRRRRLAAAIAVTAAAAAAVGFGISMIGHDSPNRAAISGGPTHLPGLPGGFTESTFQRTGSPIAGELIFNADGTVTLSDAIGSNREPLALAAPGVLRFDPPSSQDYCSVSGTYRFARSGPRLTFTKVRDTCAARVQFLTMAPWGQTTGSNAPVVPSGFPTGSLAVSGSPTQVALTVSPDGGVTLSDSRGRSQETLSFPAADRVTFSKDDFFCSVAGTYRYATTANTVRFTLVHDTCKDRRDFLTGGAFTKNG